MIRISLPYVATVFSALVKLDQIKETDDLISAWSDLFDAKQQIETLLNSSVFASALRSSRGPAATFVVAMDTILQDTNLISEIGKARLWNVRFQRDQFRTALTAELGVLPSYFVSQKEGYDTLTLLDHGTALFPQTFLAKVPEASFDAAEAAKALAFELHTAVGFHVFRALEAVLRRYFAEVSGGAAPPKMRTIAVYIRAMKDAGIGDPKVLTVLDHIRDLYRNPISHPDAVLTRDEAGDLVGIARSAIGAMLAALPEAALTTTSAHAPT